ncbi:nitroreductase family protein [Aeoliella mucimassa]|uniref:Malonic semialdehyde reductase n=1 Tax=Aeoliella mucimassa TaxID=2527972 RepID=A0A518AUT9_9BACT|nr:nitroreductase family protein [Aeoliella mucimassa]QDU58480.1 malonic semialdehyde reductase [Aeoliella mucimassa]
MRSLIKKLINTYFLPPLWRLAVWWPLLADIYFVFSGTFRREHRAVLHGKLQHTSATKEADDQGSIYTLRRNVHRLEKGLVYRPRRDVFARDYIGDTVAIYQVLLQDPNERIAPLLKWAHDVLKEYFSVVASDPAIDPPREKFAALPPCSACTSAAEEWIPYQRDSTPLNITIEDLEKLAWRRRSVRWYQDKPVPREVIDRAMEVAKLSPSACNRQPFEFRVLDDVELARKVGAIPMGTTGFSQNFPCLVVIVGDLNAYFSERDRHVIYVDGGLAAMAFQFALEVQGVGSCCINWPDIEPLEKKMAKALNLDYNHRPVMCISLGYPDPTGTVPYSQKKSLDEIRSYNKVSK